MPPLHSLITKTNLWRVSAITIVFVLVSALLTLFLLSPDLLINHGRVKWIRSPEPFRVDAFKYPLVKRAFEYSFDLKKLPKTADLHIKSRGAADIFINRRFIKQIDVNNRFWKPWDTIGLDSHLQSGNNQIHIVVRAKNKHPAVMAYCEAIDLRTGGNQWQASLDGDNWLPAFPVEAIIPPRITREFGNFFQRSYAVGAVLLFAMFALAAHRIGRSPEHSWNFNVYLQRVFNTKSIRWLLMVLWGLMAVNNIEKIPFGVGMDSAEHYKYIDFLIDNKSIPYATDGWQMFQPPLFYILASGLKSAFMLVFEETRSNLLIRLLPILCGLGMIEICYRTMVLAFPDRESLQKLGLVFGGLLPMNIYMSQVVGNEPLAGFFTSVVILCLVRLIVQPASRNAKTYAYLGLALGLGALSKPTPLLLSPVILSVIMSNSWDDRRGEGANAFRLIMVRFAWCFGAVFFICGWYYLRNYVELGRFFIGGWDPAGGNQWWQDPSFRTISQLTSFGQALIQPIYSSVYGFWDALYSTMWIDGNLSGIAKFHLRPPWNYNAMYLCGWLSLVPVVLLIGGCVAPLIRRNDEHRPVVLVVSACLLIYFAAVMYLFIMVPAYSSAKATYTLGLLPCYAIVIAAGCRPFIRRPLIGSALWGVTLLWAVSAYVSFFAVSL
jgi:hypothetical protein